MATEPGYARIPSAHFCCSVASYVPLRCAFDGDNLSHGIRVTRHQPHGHRLLDSVKSMIKKPTPEHNVNKASVTEGSCRPFPYMVTYGGAVYGYHREKALKDIKKAPDRIQRKFEILVEDLESSGPEQPHWPNYSMLGKVTYHCHLDYRWVACWRHEKDSIIIEV